MGIAELRTLLAERRRIFIDTMVFAYLLEDHVRYAEAAMIVLETVESGSAAGVTSAVTMAELLTAPAQAGDQVALRDYELYLSHFPNLTIVAVDTDLARLVATVRAATGLRLPDAIQIATALHGGCDIIVTNDKRWQEKTEPMDLVVLDTYV